MATQKINTWNKYHGFLLLQSMFLVIAFQSVLPLVAVVIPSFLFYIIQHWSELKAFRPFAGYANWVTTFRLLIVIALAFVYTTISFHQIGLLAILIIALDWVDGQLARRFDMASDFGEYLDMETDSLFVALICSILYLNGMVGWWLMPIGFLRYIYAIAVFLLAWQNRKAKSTKHATFIAGVFFVAIICPFFLPEIYYLPIVLLGALLLLFSFGYSFYSLWEAK